MLVVMLAGSRGTVDDCGYACGKQRDGGYDCDYAWEAEGLRFSIKKFFLFM